MNSVSKAKTWSRHRTTKTECIKQHSITALPKIKILNLNSTQRLFPQLNNTTSSEKNKTETIVLVQRKRHDQ